MEKYIKYLCILLVVIIVACLFFSCSFTFEGLEMKAEPTMQPSGMNLLAKQMMGDNEVTFGEDSDEEDDTRAAMDMRGNVPVTLA